METEHFNYTILLTNYKYFFAYFFWGGEEIPTGLDWNAILEKLCEAARTMADEACSDVNTCMAGVSCGGPLGANRKRICSPPNLPCWDEMPVADYL